MSEIPLLHEEDIEILKHRDVHFGENFEIMLSYYEKGGIGVMPEFDLEEIKKLQQFEKMHGSNLSEEFLIGPAKEEVQRAKQMYVRLRDLYESPNASKTSLLFGDLILSEEENPERELKALADEKGEASILLFDLLGARDYYSPLFPGFGRAPSLAAKCLQMIGDPKAIPHLFEALGHESFTAEETMIHALHSFGEESKLFLLNILHQKPLSKDNRHAACALLAFEQDKDVGQAALYLLEDPDTFKDLSLSTYLIYACAFLKKKEEWARFSTLIDTPLLPKELKEEVKLIINTLM